MDVLFEFLVGLFLEVPAEMISESRRLKPWVKTVLLFFLFNVLTLVLFVLARYLYGKQGLGEDVKAALILAGTFLTVSTIVCIIGHRKGWQKERTCPLQKPIGQPQRNIPNPHVLIRTATMADLDAIARVEAECFPAAEAATKEEFAQRLAHYADHFWLMFDGDKLISFVDGFVTDEGDLRDEMYANASLHNPAGAWQMIFGVNTIPAYRNHGYAGQLMEQAILDARLQGRKGLVLTCKPEKVPYYAKFGFVNEGISQNSTHGGVIWHQMRLTF